MQVFRHLVYEYQKELRDLCLFTCSNEFLDKIEKTLKFQKIDYIIYPLENGKINVFFGAQACLEILKHLSSSNLSWLTAEEDFILGMMLGYGKSQQYTRFLDKKRKSA